MNILFYFPTNKRANSIEILLKEFTKQGHVLTLIGMEKPGALQDWADKNGIRHREHVVPKSSSTIYNSAHIRMLIRATKELDIDLVYSHTQPANIVAVLAQYFSSARFIICRHHSDYIMNGTNRNAKRFDWVINKLGKEFLVPSEKVRFQMVEKENVKADKITVIPLAYDFEAFPDVNWDRVKHIKATYQSEILLIAVSRFIPCKRYDLLIDAVHELVSDGINLKLLILGDGPLEKEVKSVVANRNLSQTINFIGYTQDVMNYIQASDVLVHVSNSEASNSVIKEAGLLEKTIVACYDVGDFDEYITDQVSGFLISKENTKQELLEVIKAIHSKSIDISEFGPKLRESVLSHFSYQKIVPQYQQFHTS